MLGLKLNLVSKRDPWKPVSDDKIHDDIWHHQGSCEAFASMCSVYLYVNTGAVIPEGMENLKKMTALSDRNILITKCLSIQKFYITVKIYEKFRDQCVF